MVAYEWVGFVYYSVVSSPFFLGSSEHHRAIADAVKAFETDPRREDMFVSLRIPVSSDLFRNKSNEEIGIMLSNKPIVVRNLSEACELPADTKWFVKVGSALNYLDRRVFPFEGMPSPAERAASAREKTIPTVKLWRRAPTGHWDHCTCTICSRCTRA